MDERSRRVPSAQESGYCIIFFHSKISSPVEFATHSSFPSLIVTVQKSVSDVKYIYNKVFTVLYQTNAALVSIRAFFQKP